MAHKEQLDFFRKVFRAFPEIFNNKQSRVIDFGSLDLNGGPHNFLNAQYLGTDIGPGPNVDLVCPSQELQLATSSFDAAISSQCYEHNPFWRESLAQMARLTKPDGFVVWTSAGIGCVQHGTSNSKDRGISAPYIATTSDYYQNIDAHTARRAIYHDGWYSDYVFLENFISYDTYFVGLRKGTSKDFESRFAQLKLELINKYGQVEAFAFRRVGYRFGFSRLVEKWFAALRFIKVVISADKKIERASKKIRRSVTKRK
jgi:SAM-dependent methyltransferase